MARAVQKIEEVLLSNCIHNIMTFVYILAAASVFLEIIQAFDINETFPMSLHEQEAPRAFV